ncbi:hypothetical protein SEA_LEOPARD_100 [Mycobacterium phage Leopard]|nr:hypothetical protein SEA_LEOPARD_100 [Mycobacterium phage Leopard]WKW85264.1 hypothetical protein SEA_AIKOY__102 [Mycobacterium phage Aikoy]
MGFMPNIGGLDIVKTVNEFKGIMLTIVDRLEEVSKKLDVLIKIETAKLPEHIHSGCDECELVGRLLCSTHKPGSVAAWSNNES